MKRNVLTTLILVVTVQLVALSAFAGEAKIRMEANESSLQVGQEETIKVFINTNEPIGAYQFDISSNSSFLDITNIQAGADGFVTASSMDNGLIKVNGFDVNGKGPGELEFLLIKVKAKAKAKGDASIFLNPVVLSNARGQKIMVSGSSLPLSIK